MIPARVIRSGKVAVFSLSLAPLGFLGLRFYQGEMTANPIEFVTHTTGDWTLRFLILTLMITPARRILGIPELIRFRRMLGLFAFFYGSLHFLIYFALDHFFDFSEIWHDIAKHRFVTVGFAGFVLLIPLAITSTAGWIRRLGGRRWRILHRAIYISVCCGVIHFFWLVKSDIHEPVIYGLFVLVLLAYRVFANLRR